MTALKKQTLRRLPPRLAPRVAVLVDTSTSWGRRILKGISNYMLKHGSWQVFVDARGLQETLRVPPGWKGDGVIARVSNSEMVNELSSLNIPVVNVSGIQLPNECFPQVTTNLEASAKLGADYLLNRGFQHFGSGDSMITIRLNGKRKTL